MSIYSQSLGQIVITDLSTLHTLYTVPLSAGPAVIRTVSLYGNPGAKVSMGIADPSGNLYRIFYLDLGSASVPNTQSILIYMPVTPGWSIWADNVSSSSSVPWSCTVGGYQFATP